MGPVTMVLYFLHKNFKTILFRQITQTMFSQMCNACSDNNINADFMREMIPHHQGAIKMSKNVLQYPICPELDSILQAIITSQEKGVRLGLGHSVLVDRKKKGGMNYVYIYRKLQFDQTKPHRLLRCGGLQ